MTSKLGASGPTDRFQAHARDPRVAAAAAEVMPKGNAIDALVAGILAAAAIAPVVLLGPLQALVAGPGVGLMALDGRSRQPGKGVPRPRGFVTSAAIVGASHVASPGLPSALAALLATYGSMSLRRVAGPGIDLAPAPRNATLARFADEGPIALARGPVGEEILVAAGRLAGGVLTERDLRETVSAIHPCVDEGRSSRSAVRTPWPNDALAPLATEVLVVADARGLVAAACFASSEAEVAVSIEPLGLAAPALAEPVLRGVRRTSPGSLLGSPSPIALVGSGTSEGYDLALGVEGRDAERALEQALVALRETGLLPDADPDGEATLRVATRSGSVGGRSLVRL